MAKRTEPGGEAPADAKYIVQTSDGELANEQVLADLDTGILKVTTETGVLSIAVAGEDYLEPDGDGSALTDVVAASLNAELTGIVKATAGELSAAEAGTDYAAATHNHDGTYAGLASPAFTGTPTAPTAAGGTNTTQLATTAFVHDAVAALGGGDVNVYANYGWYGVHVHEVAVGPAVTVTAQTGNAVEAEADGEDAVAVYAEAVGDGGTAIEAHGPVRVDGDVVLSSSAQGVIVPDTANGHYYRLRVTNGALVLQDLGTSAP